MRGGAATALALVLVGAAAAQEQRLSDVAADIVLRPPSGDALFVDLTPERGATLTSQDMVALADEYGRHLESVSRLLAEADEDDRFYAADWRDQMLAACLDLETAGYSVAALRPPERYAQAYDELIDASEGCGRATRVVREAIRQDQPLYGPALRSLADCRPVVTRSLDEIHRIQRAELQEAPPSLDDPLAAGVAIAELCSARWGRDGSAFQDCVADQERARRAIADRFGFSVLLDEATFNVIRNQCRLEWPADFAGRDRCERQRIADAR